MDAIEVENYANRIAGYLVGRKTKVDISEGFHSVGLEPWEMDQGDLNVIRHGINQIARITGDKDEWEWVE